MIHRLSVVALIAGSLAACVPSQPRIPPPEPMAAIRYGTALEGGLFLQGFDVSWHARPHRLSHLEVGVHGGVPSDGGPFTGVLESDVRGGTWASGKMASDVPRVTLGYGGVTSPDIGFWHGSTLVTLNGRLGRRGEADAPAERAVEVSFELPDGTPTDALVVWLTGFELSTLPSHPNGYTPHSLAVRLGEPTLEGRTVRFEVFARFQAAPVLDRTQRLAEYGSGVRVDYVVVTARDAKAQRFGLQSSIDHGIEPSNLTRRIEPARMPVTVQVAPGKETAVAGLSGFEVDLLVDGPVAGRYMRSLTVALEDGRYDSGRGTYDALVAMRFANSGKLPRPVKVRAQAEFTLLQLGPDAQVREGRWSPPADGPAHVVTYPGFDHVDPEMADVLRYGWMSSSVAAED